MEWYGVILAGGMSSRMGVDKAEISWQGERFLDLAKRRLAAVVGAERVIVSGEYGGCRSVPDIYPALGPIGGLYAVCAGLPDGVGILVCPVDMPLVRAEDLVLLRDAITDKQSKIAIFVGTLMPIAIRLDAQLRQILGQLIDPGMVSGSRSLRSLISKLGSLTSLPSQHCAQRLVNINSPDELAEIRQAYEAII